MLARCATHSSTTGHNGHHRYLILSASLSLSFPRVVVHYQYLNMYTASIHFCNYFTIIKSIGPSYLLCRRASAPVQIKYLVMDQKVEYPVLSNLKISETHPAPVFQNALPVTMTFHSPDAVGSKPIFKTSAHPSHAPHAPHASSRTTDSTLGSRSRPPAPRPNGRLIFGRTVPVAATGPGPAPGTLRAPRTPAATRTSTIGAWPVVLCIRCTYVQLSLATGQISHTKKREGTGAYPGPSTNSPPSCEASPPRSHTGIPTRNA